MKKVIAIIPMLGLSIMYALFCIMKILGEFSDKACGYIELSYVALKKWGFEE